MPSGMKLSNDINVITHSDHVESLLAPYREAIGDDYEGYRGHVYRVLSYALHFLGGETAERATIETALAYHDLGLWSDKELAYLEPSIERVEADNEARGWGYDTLKRIGPELSGSVPKSVAGLAKVFKL